MISISNMFKLLILTSIIAISSCKEEYQPQDGEIKVSINHSAGQSFQFQNDNISRYFLPYPVNEGTGRLKDKSKTFAVIGKQISTGDDLYVVPVAKLKYNYDQGDKEIIISIPAQEKYRTMEIGGYNDLNTEYYSTKQILDYWYSNRYGLGAVTDVRWSPL